MDRGHRHSRDCTTSGFSLIELLVVVALFAVITVMALPMTANAVASFRLGGDARSVSNAIAVAKMRAASTFGRTRLYLDLIDNSYHLEMWDKTTDDWVVEGGINTLSSGVSFGFDPATTPPPDTQGTIGQAAICRDKDDNEIGNTGCVIFNSRGVPVDSTLAPTGDDAVYVTDGTAIYAVTVAATGMMKMWSAHPVVTPTWVAG
jgi:prepilin-type N-terminal cleavage/methylation domain-containing protein